MPRRRNGDVFGGVGKKSAWFFFISNHGPIPPSALQHLHHELNNYANWDLVSQGRILHKTAAMSDDKCPVDNKTRDAWLAQARSIEAAKAQSQPTSQPATCPVDHSSSQPKSWSQTLSSYLPWSAAAASPPSPAPVKSNLDTDREVSTIPRTTGTPSACPVDHDVRPPRPANHEMETGVDPSGNWVYPSEKMFFDAMKRKGYDARVADMKTVVPIHNAVNERAWKEIKEWEAPYLKGTKYEVSYSLVELPLY